MTKTRKITTIGMFSALAYIFTLIGHFIPISFTDFLSYDPKDAVIVIAGLSMGALPALAISVVVAFLELITISTTGIIGFVMNVISSATFACVASLIYKRIRSLGGAAIGLTVSSVLTVVFMLLWNYLITPLYMGVPREAVAQMLLPIILPFNTIKCGLNSALTMLLYKPCITALRRVGLIKAGQGKGSGVKVSPVATAVSLGLAVLMITLFIILKG